MDARDADNMSDEEEPILLRQHRRERIPMHHFLRILAGAGGGDLQPAASNDELVGTLRRCAVIKTQGVFDALTVCARDLFVPARYRGEAFIDTPIRLQEYDFNISAPHMHATCLEALEIQPGHRVLDVGSGCGVLTAAMAFMAGPQGKAVGVDIKPVAVTMAISHVKHLSLSSQRFANNAAPCQFLVHNVFMPSHVHVGAYDRIHVGASCVPDKLHALVDLLAPSGGVIVAPVHPSDLRCITKHPNGTITQRVLSQVRYGELEIPTEVQILAASIDLERQARVCSRVPPSTFATDVLRMLESSSSTAAAAGSPSSSLSSGSHMDGSERAWGTRMMTRLLSSCSRGSGGEGGAPMSDAWSDESSEYQLLSGVRSAFGDGPGAVTTELLGAPDAVLQGGGWEVPVHRAVLRARCDLFRARCESGMRDAGAGSLHCPDHFTLPAATAFLSYLYTDALDVEAEVQLAMEVLHMATYYGVGRLVSLCEELLAAGLMESDARDPAACQAACTLLTMAEDLGLTHLRSVALDFIVHNFAAVSATEAYGHLSKEHMHQVAMEAAASYSRVQQLVRSMSDKSSERAARRQANLHLLCILQGLYSEGRSSNICKHSMSQQQPTLLFLLPPSVLTEANIDLPADADTLVQPLDGFSSAEVAPSEDSTAAETSGSTCQTCHIGTGATPGFASVAEQREHFKTDWHRLNIKRALVKQPPLSEAEFAALLDHDEVGSISGSDAEDDKHDHPPTAHSSTHLLFGPPLCENGDATLHRAAWCAIIPDQSAPMLPQLRALHARGCRWGVILSSGGHFAAAVVETRVTPKARGFSDILTVLAHKTYHRYVVRAKAGGRQSNKDATGKYAKSAGSQLRRHNEAALERDIQATLGEWQPLLRDADLIFVHAPAVNGNAVFAGPNAPLRLSDSRVRRIPFVVRRPTFSEVVLVPIATPIAAPIAAQPSSGALATSTTTSSGATPSQSAPSVHDPLQSHPITVVEREPGQLSKSKKKRLRLANKKQRQRAAAAASESSEEEGPPPPGDTAQDGGEIDEVEAALAAIAAMDVAAQRKPAAAPKPPPCAAAAEERRRLMAEAAERRMAALTRASQQQALH